MNNPTAYIHSLIGSFPVLRRKVGREYLDALKGSQEFDSNDFAARFHGASTSEYAAAVFVLSVWLGTDKTPLGEFRLIEAIGTWEEPNRAAFVAWVQNPQWP